MDQAVDIGAAPIITRQSSTRSYVLPPARRVRKLNRPSAPVLLFVGIEVVVDVNTIDVVAANDVEYHVDRTLSHGRLARIHPQHAPIPLYKLRVGATDVIGGRRRFSRRMASAIRIEPRVELETALVGLGDSELEWIVPWIRRA